MTTDHSIQQGFERAREVYATLGVDVDAAVERLGRIPLSLHCWQGDDVVGFEQKGGATSGGGIQATGNYPGRARTINELQADILKAQALIPGVHRVNLHAMYGEFDGKRIDRNQVGTEHFRGWVEWARAHKVNLDFNSTCFAHPLADSGFTLSSADPAIRAFWVDHVQRCRDISAFMGRELGSACMHDLWIPDGAKDVTVLRAAHRLFLKESLDKIYAKRLPREVMLDAVECKLFGIGSEFFVVGSHEFYLGYIRGTGIFPCLDMGHFHPTESVADKISALLPFVSGLLIHVSRGVRWDSDHVVILNDDLRALAEELVRSDALDRAYLALDYFDASINRVGAWVIGARATLKALLYALLEPRKRLQAYERDGNGFARLALLEEAKTMPAGAVWDYFCAQQEVPTGATWIQDIATYEKLVLAAR
jgi:L-rhamnose isomerase